MKAKKLTIVNSFFGNNEVENYRDAAVVAVVAVLEVWEGGGDKNCCSARRQIF